MTVVVSDTSPLNYLVMIGEVEILQRLYDRVLIPFEVLAELEDSGTPSQVLQWVRARPGWLEVRKVDIHHDETALNQLDDGERAAILLAQQESDVLLLIDEFQEFFVEDDKISQTASLLLDRIVRQGRAFGIHVLLGSQTLGGAYTVARTTLGQMVIRVALQCNEADAYLIMDDTNPAPRLLSRPGEGIYNDIAGALEGNSPFQTVCFLFGSRCSRWEQYSRRLRAPRPPSTSATKRSAQPVSARRGTTKPTLEVSRAQRFSR